MKYEPSYFQKTMPEWKKKKDPVIARLIHRPISFVFSSVFVELGFTANQVSFVALIIALLTCILFLSSNIAVLIVAFFMLNLWSIVDSADGNIARSLGGRPYGDFIDATSSYLLYGVMFLSLGYSVYCSGGLVIQVGTAQVIAVGALTGMFDTMTRLFFQKMKNNTYEMEKGINHNENKAISVDRSNSMLGRIQIKIDSEFTCGGTVHLLLLLICILTRTVDVYISIYFVYNGLTFLVSLVYLIAKTKCLS